MTTTVTKPIILDETGQAIAAAILQLGGDCVHYTEDTGKTAEQKAQARTNIGASDFSGAYADLTGKPELASVATSGAYSDLTGKPTIPSAINTSTAASITLANAQAMVVTNLPTALEITLPTPTAGCDFLTGAIFRAGADFALTENAPNDWTIHYEDTPEWTAGKMYEIIYRALWLPISIGETDVSAGTVAVDSLTFQSTNAAVGDYTYTYDGSAWKDSNSTTVTLATLGITLTGTAASGDTITISNLKCISAKVAEVTA